MQNKDAEYHLQIAKTNAQNSADPKDHALIAIACLLADLVETLEMNGEGLAGIQSNLGAIKTFLNKSKS